MNLKNIIFEEIEKLIENTQLADKVYFNTGKLSNEDKEIILNITNGDNYTKLIADFYFFNKEHDVLYNSKTSTLQELKLLYNDAKTYDKNVYPIIGYDVYNSKNISDIIFGLKHRRNIIQELKKLPSIAIRNLKNDIRKERTSDQLKKYFSDLEYFMSHYSLLSNRDKDTQIKILRKMFKGDTTLDQLMRFVDDKQNFIGGVDFTKDDVKKMSESEDFEIIYEQGDVMIVRVDSPDGIKAIGCNSLWCFTYGSGFDSAYRQWNNYSYNDMVYVIIDFKQKSDSEDFMHVLIEPLTDDNNKLIKYTEDDEDKHPLFNMSNENYWSPYPILNNLFGKDYKKIIKQYLNFDN